MTDEMKKSQEPPSSITPEPGVADVSETFKSKMDYTTHDQGAALFQEVQEYSPEELEAESAKVRRLIDWHIMPIVSYISTIEISRRVNLEIDLYHLYDSVLG